MKVKDIISETFGPGFSSGEANGYSENHAAEMEQETINSEMSADYKKDRTPVREFDLAEIKRLVSPAARNGRDVKKQVDSVIADWQEMMDEDSYIEDELFNKAFSQYQGLKDSKETPLIKFNKMHAITKEVKDAADKFEEYSNSDKADEWKDEKGYF